MRIVFFGTPEFALEFLRPLDQAEDILVSAVVCQPDKPVGREKILTAPSVKQYALEHDLQVLQPQNLEIDVESVEALKALKPDLFVIVAYGKIIPAEILDIPKLGSINIHPSLLPKYRGPSPIQSAIMNGETESGVSIMLIDEEMDHGPILAQEKIIINDAETPESFQNKVVEIGTPLLLEMIKNFDQIQPQEQNHEQATFCKMLTREDGQIDWTCSAHEIDCQIRGLSPWPGTWTKWNGKTLKIIRATINEQNLDPGLVKIDQNKLLVGTGSTALAIDELQLAGKQKMNAEQFIHGYGQIDSQKLG